MKDLEICDELIIKLGFPVDLLHGDSLPESIVEKLAEYRSASEIFNCLEVEVESLVDPLDDLLSGDKVSFIHESDGSCVMIHFAFVKTNYYNLTV